MKSFSQKDKAWGNLLIGSTNLSMKLYGCFITSLSMIAEKPPDVVLGILNRNNAFNHEGLLLSEVAAKALGLDYGGYQAQPPNMDCIAETNHFYPTVPQHFFVLLKSGKIIDPLDAATKKNPYKIVSYRLFSKKIKEEPKVDVLITPTVTFPVEIVPKKEDEKLWIGKRFWNQVLRLLSQLFSVK